MIVGEAICDVPMIALLLPVSDKGARRSAMWNAARLDHLDIVMQLAAAGIPLDIWDEVIDENATLLVAAASGAALRVGRWLIEERGLPVDAIASGPDDDLGEAPAAAALDLMRDTGSRRVAPFLQMLVAHGADIDAHRADEPSLLQRAIVEDRKDEVQVLPSVGARRDNLSSDQKHALHRLLAQTERPVLIDRDNGACVTP